MAGSQHIDSTPAPSGALANVVLIGVTCDSSVYVKAAVKMNVSGVAFNALADSEANSNVIGLCVKKLSTTKCNIRVLGVTAPLFTGLDPTKTYFLSDTVEGEITTVVPTASGHVVLPLGQPFSGTEFFIKKEIRQVRS